MSESSCRYAGRAKARLLRSHVDDDCPSSCEGCEPCPQQHCGQCGKTHVTLELTCPACVGSTREDIAAIVDMSGRVLIEAMAAGVNSEAANLAGPTANPEAWSWRALTARQGRADHVTLVESDDSTHPAWVLGTWEMLTREHLEQPGDDLLSITTAAAYLDLHLTRLANEGDFAFEEMARDVRKCRGHLEDVLHEGVREERGEKCPMCDRKQLVKDYGTTAGDKVRWRCPNADCGTWYSEQEYLDKVKTRYIGVAPELNMTDLALRLPLIPASTLRRWASRRPTGAIVDGAKVYAPALLKACGRDDSGRKLYRVADVEALSDAAGRMSA